MIQMTLTSNGPAFQTTARGVSYYLRRDILGRYELTSQRLALRAARMGGTVRHFANLEEVDQKVRAFSGIALLVEG